jgi:hypothetical protein
MAASWFCAVTTAPRRDCTLLRCVDSMQIAGFDPVVFAEPGSTRTDCETITNPQRLGVWHNWLASCRYALSRDVDFIMTVQDDSLFHPDSREFIESIKWPINAAFVSLYTPKHYSRYRTGKPRPTGVNRIVTRSLWGACALVWRPQVLEQVINHKIAKSWAGARPRSGNPAIREARLANPHTIANSDTAIGKIANEMGLSMYFVDPSPVSHIAIYSTIGHGGNDGRRNAYRIADHSLPLAYQVFGR